MDDPNSVVPCEDPSQNRAKPQKTRKQIRHKFLDRHTVAGALILTVWAFLASQVLFALAINLPLGLVLPSDVSLSLSGAISGLIVLALHKRWFYPEFEGCLPGQSFRAAWLPVVVMLVLIWVPSIIQNIMLDRFGAPTLASVSASLLAGISEEVAFRGIPGSYLMRQWRDERKLLPTVFFTSALFGLVHGLNFFAGAPLDSSILQVIVTFAMGMVLCALFLRTGSLVPSMLIHTAHDIISLTDRVTYEDSSVISVSMELGDWLWNMLICVVMVAVTLFLLRPSQRQAVRKIWDRKWSAPIAPPDAFQTV